MRHLQPTAADTTLNDEFRYGLADTEMRVLRRICRLTKTRSETTCVVAATRPKQVSRKFTGKGLKLYEEG